LQNDDVEIAVFPSFVATIDLLEDCGLVLGECGDRFLDEGLHSVDIHAIVTANFAGSLSEGRNGKGEEKSTDQEEISHEDSFGGRLQLVRA
jgi:hypothetical protein